MSKLKNIKKILSALVVTILFVTFTSTAFAISSGDVGKFFGDMFSNDEQGLTFTDYEGEVVKLDPDGLDPALTKSTNVKEFIIKIVNFALTFLGLVAVIIVIYGGALYLFSAGEDEKIQKGRKAIAYASIGILIILGSYAFVNTIIKGAQGEQDIIGGTQAAFSGKGFNASAEEVRSLAFDVYNGFAFLAESMEEVKNIKNDVLKESLAPANRPSKSEVLNFLRSVKSKFNNVKSKIQPFSETEAIINELLRDVDTELDQINGLPDQIQYLKINEDKTDKACPSENKVWDELSAEEAFAEAWSNATYEELCHEAGYTVSYIKGLTKKWADIYLKYSEYDEKLYGKIVKPIASDYSKDLKDIFLRIAEIYSELNNIEAVSAGEAGNAMQKMMSPSGYGFSVDGNTDPNQITTATTIASNSGLLSNIETWGSNIDTYDIDSEATKIETISGFVMAGLSAHHDLYQAIFVLEFVKARLTANVVEGSAPLTVIFDSLGSEDPAGGSIQGDNIIWDLSGKDTLSELFAEDEQVVLPEGTFKEVTCDIPEDISETDYERFVIGKTSKRCTFHTPGTYTAAVKINSNSPTQYAPGISILVIKVKPPTTKIELAVSAGTGDPIQVMHYSDDILIVDKREVTVTLNDASKKDGVKFDASSTEADKFSWNFGNGESVDFSTNGSVSTDYDEAGAYNVTLTVLSKLGVEDKKAFTLKVSSVAARIKAFPRDQAFINSPVIFDASESKSDLGEIKNYKWTISVSDNQAIPQVIAAEIQDTYPFEKSGGSLKTLTHEFKYPIEYDVEVQVTDDSDPANTDAATIYNFRVESKHPVANYSHKIPQTSQPGTVHLNGSKSFDPDGKADLIYEWTIDNEENWEWVTDSTDPASEKEPVVKFNKVGDYQVTLRVTDSIAKDELDETTKTITISKVLDVKWAEDQVSTGVLNDEGEAVINFKIESDNALAYEIDFDDGDISTGDINKSKAIPHTYSEGGKFTVKVTVYDEDDNDTNLERRFFISRGDKPLAKISLRVNGVEIMDLTKPLEVSKKDILTFDGSDSKNMDGTGRNLKYSWGFGDTEISSSKSATHSYNEVSPLDPGYHEAILTVYDSNDADLRDTDEVQIKVINMHPEFSSIQAVPDISDPDLTTPINVKLRVYGAEDEDGQITQYKWWYFDVDDPDEKLGLQITSSSTANLTIGTNGKEGLEVDYGFGLEVVDNENLSTSSKDLFDDEQVPQITVTNGKNDLPEAAFKVNTTSIFTGEKIIFTSSSKDSDGKIESYYWDFEGDGFSNNSKTDKSTVEFTYTQKNLQGYDVRLKVIDDKGGENISAPMKIYVDTLADPPNAAFNFEVLPGSQGEKIQFYNNSTVDTEAGAQIISYKWDFDTSSSLSAADSDGDGQKDNDTDSQAQNPKRLYSEDGKFTVKLTVTDNQGNSDDVTRTVTIPLADPPTAAFTYEVVNGKVKFQNHSISDLESGAEIVKYVWDFDTTVDKNGDGQKDNDNNSTLRSPSYEYKTPGTYQVKLTVTDDQGNSDDVINTVDAVGGPSSDDDGGDDGTTLPTDDDGTTPPADGDSSDLKAVITTTPIPDADGIVILQGDDGQVSFDFSKSVGPIAYFIFDKNLYYDTDGNDIKNDDEDFKTNLPGTWTTNFDKSFGKIVVKLIVVDIYGNKDAVTQEIKFN